MADLAVYPSPRRDLFILLVISPLLIAGCLGAPFLDYDDDGHVASPVATGAVPWYEAFEHPYGSIFPLTALSFRVENAVYHQALGIRNWAPFARVANLLLHATAAVSLWYLLRALQFGHGAQLFVTGAFLLHPMACESVCWISERKNGLVAAFGFGALAVSAGFRGRMRPVFVGALFVAAMLSKPSAFGLLPVLLAWEIWKIRKESQAVPIQRNLVASIGLGSFLILAGIGGARYALHSHEVLTMPPPGGSAFTALLTDAEIVRRYMQSLVLPIDLSFAYCVKPILSPAEPRFLINTLVVAIVVAGTMLLSKRRQLSLFFWFWFFSALGPNLNLVATACLMQDRYVYLSTPAFFAALALALEGLSARVTARSIEKLNLSGTGQLALWGLLVALATGSLVRSQLFHDDYQLFNDAVTKQPYSALAQITLGVTMARWSDQMEATQSVGASGIAAVRKEAAEHLRLAGELGDRARLISPGHSFAALGHVHFKLGLFDEAEADARKVLETQFHAPVTAPIKKDAYNLLAQIAIKRGKYDEAVGWADQALAIANIHFLDVPEVWIAKGQALEGLHRNSEAVTAYSKVARGMAGFEDAQKRIEALQIRPSKD